MFNKFITSYRFTFNTFPSCFTTSTQNELTVQQYRTYFTESAFGSDRGHHHTSGEFVRKVLRYVVTLSSKGGYLNVRTFRQISLL